jgi:hypothetical protein
MGLDDLDAIESTLKLRRQTWWLEQNQLRKFGTIATTAEVPAILAFTRSIFSLLQPLVPTKSRKLLSIAKSTTRSETSGFVKSMTKSAPMSLVQGVSRTQGATVKSKSLGHYQSDPSVSWPIRPDAPIRLTLVLIRFQTYLELAYKLIKHGLINITNSN